LSGRGRRLADWFDSRLAVSAAMELLRKKTVPVHRHSFWYFFGGMTLFFFGVQVVTGILLLLYYRPTAESAYESVQFIMTDVRFGWLIRSIHSWSANLMVLSAFVHLFSTFLLKSYRKPRELTWISGALLLFLTLGFGFTGYLLPWNKLAFFATQVGTRMAEAVPFIGRFALVFLRGGEHVTGATLTRLFAFHVALLPAIAVAVLGIHLFLVQKHGMSVPVGVREEETEPFWPDFLTKDLLGWTLALAALVLLAAVFPWELGEKADPFAPAPAGIKPEWYFLFMFETLKLFPARILLFEGEQVAILAFGVLAVLFVFVPFLDRWSARERKSPVFTVLGVVGIAYVVVMTLVSFLR